MNDKFLIPDCKLFNGYKPCMPGKNCLENCSDRIDPGIKILFISLEAMGTVLMSTALLPDIKRKYPVSTIHWITYKNSIKLLDNNTYIDKVWEWNFESVLILKEMEFDIVLNIDKTLKACALIMNLRGKEKLGFGLNTNGAIIPLNSSADYAFRMGLDDKLKFRENQKTGLEILAEALELPYFRDEYILNLSKEETEFCDEYKRIHNLNNNKLTVGFNTGCSELFPNKKMTIEQHIYLIDELSKFNNINLVLLGGREDTERNLTIAEKCKGKVINTPTTEGIRKGICYENICDVIITGDSFGMHIAVGLKKYVIAWFGLSCWTEIELYDRGVKLFQPDLDCSPCWKKACPYDLECIKNIDLNKIIKEVKKIAEMPKA